MFIDIFKFAAISTLLLALTACATASPSAGPERAPSEMQSDTTLGGDEGEGDSNSHDESIRDGEAIAHSENAEETEDVGEDEFSTRREQVERENPFADEQSSREHATSHSIGPSQLQRRNFCRYTSDILNSRPLEHHSGRRVEYIAATVDEAEALAVDQARELSQESGQEVWVVHKGELADPANCVYGFDLVVDSSARAYGLNRSEHIRNGGAVISATR